MGGKVAATFSLPSFGQNFSEKKGITNEELIQEFEDKLAVFLKSME
jgi:hypothetical protein